MTDALPIGIFDSGVGGLTVAREIRRVLPDARLVYVGDSIHIPYGQRPDDDVRALSLAIARFLTERCGCGAVVIACNTATSAAAESLRAALPVPVIGMEPGVKPAARATRTGKIGVLATAGTLSGPRFATLVSRFADGIEVLTQPCPGWVEAIEAGDLTSERTRTLVAERVEPLLARGVDTLVLGCTHYPLLRPMIQAVAGPDICLIDTEAAVARQVLRVAAERTGGGKGTLGLFTTGEPQPFAAAAAALFGDDRHTIRRLFWKGFELTSDGTY